MAQEHPQAAEIRRHLADVLASPGLARSQKLSRFLRWTVERTLDGNQVSITERSVAIEVYERGADFDPKLDGTVRAEAIRLRNKLREFYENAGGLQRIEIPKGGYVPVFCGFEAIRPEPRPAVRRMRIAAAAALVTLVILGFQMRGWSARRQHAESLLKEANFLLLAGDNVAAEAKASAAVQLEPGDAGAHTALARASMNLNHDLDAALQARLATQLARPGTREAAQAEAQQHLLDMQPAKAAAVYSALAEAEPQDVNALLYLAQAQIRDLHYRDAIATVARAQKIADGARSPEFDRLAALAWGVLAVADPSLRSKSLEAIARARRKAEDTHLPGAIGRVLLLEGGLRANASMAEESAESVRSAREICDRLQDDVCVAATFRIDGNKRVAAGRYLEALDDYDRALPMALRWQSRGESGTLMEGIEAAVAGLRQAGIPEPMGIAGAPHRPVFRR